MTGYKGLFHPKWWAWYLVNVKDWRNPIIVRKHFLTEEETIDYRQRWMDTDFQSIVGYEALELGMKWTKRHGEIRATKYHFPDWCKTQHQRFIFRMRLGKELKRKNRLRKLTYKDLYYMLDKRPIKFCIRTKAFSKVENVTKSYVNLPNRSKSYIRLVHIVELTLKEYGYDKGRWSWDTVSYAILDRYQDTIVKFTGKSSN